MYFQISQITPPPFEQVKTIFKQRFLYIHSKSSICRKPLHLTVRGFLFLLRHMTNSREREDFYIYDSTGNNKEIKNNQSDK